MIDFPIRRRMNFAAIGLAAAMSGAAMALPSNAPMLPKPPHVLDATPRQKRALENQRNQAANRKRRAEKRDPDEAARQRRINGMTNWQRSQWGRAGYPKNRIEEFLCMARAG